MTRMRHGTYVFLVFVPLCFLLGWFSDEIVSITNQIWMGSTFFLVIVSVTLSELVVISVCGRPVEQEYRGYRDL